MAESNLEYSYTLETIIKLVELIREVCKVIENKSIFAYENIVRKVMIKSPNSGRELCCILTGKLLITEGKCRKHEIIKVYNSICVSKWDLMEVVIPAINL